MSSTPESIPVTRRSHGGLAIALGVLLAIVVAVALIAVTGSKTTVPAQHVRTSQATVTATPHAPNPGARKAGAVINGGPGAAVGNTASSPTVLPNANPQQLRAQNLKALRAEDLPGWLLR